MKEIYGKSPARLRTTIALLALTAAAEAAELRGQVFVRGTRDPVAGAHVAASRADGQVVEAETDIGGGFALRDLGPGRYAIVVTGADIVRSSFNETIAPNQAGLTVRYFVDARFGKRYQTVVTGAAERVEVARTLTTEEMARLPGTSGDALRAVANLPGMARAPFNSGLIIVRGGKPTDSRAFFAGTEVPQLYHFGGFTSIVPTHLVDKIDYFPGNFSARYGRAIAGVIDVDLRPGKRDRVHGYGDTNAFDTGFGLEGPIGKGSFILGARRSYIDAILATGAASGLLGSSLQFTSAPVYYDYQVGLDYPLGGGKFRAMLLGSDDILRFLIDKPADVDPSLRGEFSTHIFFHRLQLRWTRTSGPWSVLAQTSTGYTGTGGTVGPTLDFSIGAIGSDWRLEARRRFSRRFQLLLGTDTQLAWVNLSARVPLPINEGELPLPLAAATKYRAEEEIKVANVGLYAEAPLKLTERLTVTPGLRFDYFSAIRKLSVGPRLVARYQIGRLTALRAGLGLYSQDPMAPDYDPIFGNPRLRPEQAVHAALTLEQALAPGLTFEATGFYKHLSDLVTPSNQLVLGTDGKVGLEKRSNDGEGRVYGGEFMLRQALSKWMFGWISYTLMRSERRACSTCGWRLFDYDQTHVLIAALSFTLPRGFGAGLRFRYVSGYPYTPPRGGQYDADGDVYIPMQIGINTARLEAFHQLDLRVDKTFTFNRWLLKVYLDVSNVYNHANPEQMQFSYDYTRQVPVTGLPLIPSFGIRGEF